MLVSPFTHSSIFAHFSKNHKDFTVKECPAYSFSGNGEWLILRACKRDLTTQNLISDLSAATGIKAKDIGYAGLKDREGYTEQFLSVPRNTEAAIKAFEHPKASIHIENYHENKLKIGHLIGNKFFIRLKKVNPVDAQKLTQAFNAINSVGFANYYGYQRFGRNADNAATAIDILKNGKKFGKKLNKFLISALQSELFNEVLAARIRLNRLVANCKAKEIASILRDEKALFTAILPHLSPEQSISYYANDANQAIEHTAFANNFLLLEGERYLHYPFGKVFNQSADLAAQRFQARDIAPAGLILGAKPTFASHLAGRIEQMVLGEFTTLLARQNGSVRHFISFASELKTNYNEQKAHFCAEFFLQKGCYATTLLEQALGRSLREEQEATN